MWRSKKDAVLSNLAVLSFAQISDTWYLELTDIRQTLLLWTDLCLGINWWNFFGQIVPSPFNSKFIWSVCYQFWECIISRHWRTGFAFFKTLQYLEETHTNWFVHYFSRIFGCCKNSDTYTDYNYWYGCGISSYNTNFLCK